MKVWIINHYAIPPSMGGLVRHYYFSKYLKEKGHEVKIFTSSKIHNANINMISGKELFIEKEVDGVEYTFVRTSNYKGNRLGRIINMLQFPFRVWRVCKRFEKPDVIYTSSPSPLTAVAAVLLAKKLKVPKVVEIRDLWPESIVENINFSRKNPIIWLCYRLEKWLYKNADRIIFTMQGGENYIKEKKWDKAIELAKIEQINNGVDLEEFYCNVDKYQLYDSDLLNEKIYKVVYAGSIRKANNVGFIVDCAKQVMNSMPDVKFLIWGEGTDKSALEKRCKEEGISNVIFKGRVEKKYIPYILSNADVNFQHCKKTGLSKYGCSMNKLFEYLASGRLILSDIPAEYDILEENQCGLIAKRQEPELIEQMIKIGRQMSCEERELYSLRARECAKAYDYKTLTEKLEKILLSVRDEK